ncbi:MAG: FAD-dependent monooxygenase [Mycolicibacterium neoaurum]|uniref:FAD-dependent monooxygenase n=1 Tax=Mycolicibacterium neoaurum TaxID=1795 RepID=UPI002FFC9D98
MTPHAVISGAGIAGPALAHQLHARGWRTTVIERFPRRREEGQNVDIRGAAREVVRRMGIESDVRAAGTGEVGTRFVTAEGRPAASFPVGEPGGHDGPTAELEILRGELSRILIEHTPDTEYRFDSQIADVTDHGDGVSTALQDGTVLESDLLVIAEGLHSRSRRFVTDVGVRELGMYLAYATIPRRNDDDMWWNWQHATRRRSVHLRPDNLGTTRAILTFMSDLRGFDELDRDGQVTILRRTFADVGGAAPRILADIEAGAPMYFSAVGQVRAPVWSRGRIALLGDAAFCNATFGGAGTSLALIGGYVLAGELAVTPDVTAALAGYRRTMQPFLDTAPEVRESMLRLANPHSGLGVRAVRAIAALSAGPVGRAVSSVVGDRFTDIAGAGLRLPDYPSPETTAGIGPAARD